MTSEDRAEHLVKHYFHISLLFSDPHFLFKELLHHLGSLSAGPSDCHDTLARVMQNLNPHAESEEAHDLLALGPHLRADGSKEAATSFSGTKKPALTRW